MCQFSKSIVLKIGRPLFEEKFRIKIFDLQRTSFIFWFDVIEFGNCSYHISFIFYVIANSKDSVFHRSILISKKKNVMEKCWIDQISVSGYLDYKSKINNDNQLAIRMHQGWRRKIEIKIPLRLRVVWRTQQPNVLLHPLRYLLHAQFLDANNKNVVRIRHVG